MANYLFLRLLVVGVALFVSLSICVPTSESYNGKLTVLSKRASVLYTLWASITGDRKVIGDSARPFTIDQSSSNAWATAYLYGCTALAISDRTFVIMAHLQQEGSGSCIQLGDSAAVQAFINNQLEPALDAHDPTANTKVEFTYASRTENADVGINLIEGYIYNTWAGDQSFGELGGNIRRWPYTSGGMGVPNPDSPQGLLVVQYIAGAGNPTGNVKVFYGTSPSQENPISEDPF